MIVRADRQKFVAINPVVNTEATLSKYIGSHTDHYDRPFTLDQTIVDEYPDFLPSYHGMVLLDMGDELIDSLATLEALGHQMSVHTFAGGSHRFSHIDEALPLIIDMSPQK